MRSSRWTLPRPGDSGASPSASRGRHLPLGRSGLGVVAVGVVAALLPLVLATLAFGNAFRSSETGRIDARLAAAAQAAAVRAAAVDAAAVSRARSLANERRIQVAMLRHDAAALAAAGKATRFYSISATDRPTRAATPPGTLQHEIAVVSGKTRVGLVRADVR